MKAVIVDDEFRSIEMIEWLLGKYFPEVKIIGKYGDSRNGLKAINKLLPDLIFLDIQMPVMNGFELLSMIQSNKLCVIYLTAYNGSILDELRALKVPHLLKPVDHDDFKNMVLSFIDGDLQPISNSVIERLVNLQF